MFTSTTDPREFERFRTMLQKLEITHGDMAGPILVVVGKEHRRQQTQLFATQGATGQGGKWPALNPRYAARKAAVFGRRKVLQLSGDMKARFTKASHPAYVQSYEAHGETGTFVLGARSSVAAAHFYGNPALAAGLKSAKAARIFGGTARRLPRRDPVSKTIGQAQLILLAIRDWYINKRIPQVLRHQGRGRT